LGSTYDKMYPIRPVKDANIVAYGPSILNVSVASVPFKVIMAIV